MRGRSDEEINKHLPPPLRKRQRDERQGLEQINKRAAKKEAEFLSSFGDYDLNPTNSFLVRNTKTIAYIAVESSHNTFFHFIETVKVRN